MAAASGSSDASLAGGAVSCHVFFPPQVQDKLLLSACHLLVSLATTVRPVFLISIPAVQKVFNRITDTSAQRLVDKVRPQGSPGVPGALWLRLREAEEEESNLSSCTSSLQALPAYMDFLHVWHWCSLSALLLRPSFSTRSACWFRHKKFPPTGLGFMVLWELAVWLVLGESSLYSLWFKTVCFYC